jgi:hypothetical protein
VPGAGHGITSDGFFELERRPDKVAIVGSGYIAAELSGVLHALGTEVTLVLRREDAESAGLSYQFVARLITLTVHSSLDAVGFLAAITARLAEAGIAVNAVSAFHHDHLFVPEHRAEEALAVMKNMSTPNSG